MQQQPGGSSAVDRQALLAAAARFDSGSSDSGSDSGSDSDSRRARRKQQQQHKKDSSSSKKRKAKHSSKKSHKSHKRHKRSDHEKIAELERRAAAQGAGGRAMGAPNLHARLGFRHSTGAAGDAVFLDTSGDANNTLYETLYGGDVPRYNRLDPLDLVRVNRRLGRQMAGDAEVGNTTADRYYRGRHFLQERSRSAKRIHLSELKRPHSSRTIRQHGRPSTLLLPPPAPLVPPPSKAAAAVQQQEQLAGSSGRRLVIPAPAFIPLEAPEELLQQAGVSGAGGWQQQGGQAGASSKRQQVVLAPAELVEQAGLTADELLLQATRAWNVAVRERPQDEGLWLDFAAFQHTAAAQQQVRGRVSSTAMLDPVTAEKQISLLSRGLTHHPSSTQLLLALLRCFAAVAPDADALEAKWAGVLSRQGGSWELWREYIAMRQSSFADFKVSGLQKAYADALFSLQLELLAHRRKAAAAHKQQHKQPVELTQQQLQQLTPSAAAVAGATGSNTSSGLGMPITLGEEALELQLVQLLLGLLHAEVEAGLCEQALAKIQALLEFHLFAPQLPPGGVPALLRLFAAYWSAGVPRIGESGARGWAYWCCWHAMGLEQPAPAPAEDHAEDVQQQQQQHDPAGWSGWFEVPPQAAAATAEAGGADTADEGTAAAGPAAPSQEAADGDKQRASSDKEDEEPGSDDDEEEGSVAEQEEGEAVKDDIDEEELMRQLGVQLEQQLQEVERQGLPADVLARWVHEEATCSASQWQPLRPGSTANPQAEAAEEPTPADPARVAGLDCVEPCLFLLRNAAALKRLVLGCVELLGAQMPGVYWCSSNCPTPFQQQALSLPDDHPGRGQHNGSNGSGSGRGASSWSDAAADGAAPGGGGSAPQQQQQQQQQWQHLHQTRWCAASDERWQWVVNLLQRLVAGGPCSSWAELCQALVLLQASKPSLAAAATTPAGGAASSPEQQQQGAAGLTTGADLAGMLQQLTLDGAALASSSSAAAAGAAGGADSTGLSPQQLSAGRAAAKQLLSDQQDNLLLYDAYGCLEASAGQVKTARKVFETALALATAAAATAPATGQEGQDKASATADAVALLALHLAQLELTAGSKAGLAKAHVALHALLAGQQLQAAAATESAGGKQQQPQQQTPSSGLLADAQLRSARLAFQQRIPELIGSAGGFLTPAAASTIAAAALFELTVGLRRSDAAAGLDAAVAVCKQVTAAVPEAIRASSAQHEQLAVLQCHMLVAAATGNSNGLTMGPGGLSTPSRSSSSGSKGGSGEQQPGGLSAALAAAVSPARAREALAGALQMYPQSKGLLQLQVALDHACCTLAGLRRQLAALAEMHPSPALWAVALQAEAARPGGRVRLGSLFERALAAPAALQWHQQERLQRQRRDQAWAGAGCQPPQQKPGQQQPQGQALAEQRQSLQLQPVSAAGSAVALLDVALWDGYRGWGHCSPLWLQYIQYELGMGRLDAARKLFLRAVHAVPGSKGLWLSGLGGVCSGLQPRECSGLLNVMQEREVMVRRDVYEVLLEAVAAKQQVMEF